MKKQSTVLLDRMLAVIADVNARVAEREELVECIAIALLTRKNLFILGEPGQAKSYAINAFRSRITGARQFERLLSKQTDEEQLFGRVDLASLIPGSVPKDVLERNPQYQEMYGQLKAQLAIGQGAGDLPDQMERHRKALAELHSGEPQVNTSGKIPESDVVFLDEIFKCNDGVLNSLLTALNERKYTNEGRTYPIPTISFFAASNEIPNFADPQEKILEALYDRLELKVVTANIADRDKRLAILRDKQAAALVKSPRSLRWVSFWTCSRQLAESPSRMLSTNWRTISSASSVKTASLYQIGSISITTLSSRPRRGSPAIRLWSRRTCWR